MKEIEFWFSIGSTYTYLSVTRLKEVEQKFEAGLQDDGYECGRFSADSALLESRAQAATSGNSAIHSNLNKINCPA